MKFLPLLLLLSGCATTYRGAVTGPSAFSFGLTPEQCDQLKRERRNYEATREAASYAAGAGLLCTGLLLGFTEDKTATALCTGAGALAEGATLFTASQVKSLDQELASGGCSR